MMKFLCLLLLVMVSRGLSAQLTYEKLWVDYDSAWEYKSMKIIPIRAKVPGGGASGGGIISLSQAMQRGIAVITERGTASTENVHWLRVNNTSDKTIYIPSGQLITGGRQDRMVTRDTLMAPSGGDQYIPVMCVEEGRWSEKEKKFMYANYANLRLRKTLDKSKNQALIWKEIFAQLDSASLKSPTLAYSGLKQTKNYQLMEEAYLKYFTEKFKNSDSAITGFVCVTASKIVGCDIFASGGLFFQELEPMLYGYINDVLMNGGPPVMEEEKIKAYMDKLLTSETTQEEYCRTNGKIFRSNGRVIHVAAY